jgi:hypothetical protein
MNDDPELFNDVIRNRLSDRQQLAGGGVYAGAG